jgi:hypothetical protein
MHTSFEIKEEMEKRIRNLLSGTETVSLFCYKATESQIKRLEARNERARLQMIAKDEEMLLPILQSLINSNKLKIDR